MERRQQTTKLDTKGSALHITCSDYDGVNRVPVARLIIRSIPTLALFGGGQEVKRLQGAMPAAQILASLPG